MQIYKYFWYFVSQSSGKIQNCGHFFYNGGGYLNYKGGRKLILEAGRVFVIQIETKKEAISFRRQPQNLEQRKLSLNHKILCILVCDI